MISKIELLSKKFSKIDFFNNELSLLKKKQKDKNEIKKRKSFLYSLKLFKNIFVKNKFWIVLKIKEIPKGHSDVDILINKKELNYFKSKLENKSYNLTGNQYNKDFGFQKQNISTIIELHCGLFYLGIDYIDFEKVLKRKIQKNIEGIKIPYCSPEDDFLIFSAHSLFQNNPTQDYKGWSIFNLSDIYQFYWDSRHKDFDWDYILEISKKYNWAEGIYYVIKLTQKIFPNKSFKKGEKLFSKNISDKLKKQIDKECEKIINYPYIINPRILFNICKNKAKNDKSIKEMFIYIKWFLYNKGAVLLKKKIFK